MIQEPAAKTSAGLIHPRVNPWYSVFDRIEEVHSEPENIYIVGETFGTNISIKMQYRKTPSGDIEIREPYIVPIEEISWMPDIMEMPF